MFPIIEVNNHVLPRQHSTLFFKVINCTALKRAATQVSI